MASIATRIELSQKRLTDLADTVAERVTTARRRATQRAEIAAGSLRDGALATAYSAGSSTLDGVATTARILPLTGSICDALESRAAALTDRERELAVPPIANYDELNVREVGEALGNLSAWNLQKVRRYEQAHKNRKTVLGAIERLMR